MSWSACGCLDWRDTRDVTVVEWSRAGDNRLAQRRNAENARHVVESVRNVVKHDERTSSGSSQVERSKTQEDSSVARPRRAVSGDSRGVRDNGPSSVRRPAQAQRRLKKAVGLGDKVAVSFAYDPVLITAIKALNGRKWEAEGKRWICSPSPQLQQFLTEHMFDVDDFANRMLAAAATTVNVVVQEGPVLILKAGYNPQMVEKIRSIPSRRWDKAKKTWTFSIVAIDQVEELATEFGLGWQVAEGKVDDGETVEVRNGWLAVRFSADRDIQEMIGELYGTRLDVATMRWVVPVEYAPEIATAANKYGWTWTEESQKVFRDYSREIELFQLSRSQDASVEIAGLGIELMPFQKAGVMYVLKAIGAEQTEHGAWNVRTPTPQESHD
jgi:hypothetical protein